MSNVRIGVDLDGVLACFNRSFVRTINEIWPGRIKENPPDEQLTVWHWPQELYGMTEEEVSQTWERVKQTENFWLHEEPYPDSVEAMYCWLNAHPDASVYYITSRVPTLKGNNVMWQTERWLQAYGLSRPNTAVLPVMHNSPSGTPPKNLVCEALGISAHLDDYLPTVVSLSEKGVLLDRAWNRDKRPTSVKVVGSLAEFLEGLK